MAHIFRSREYIGRKQKLCPPTKRYVTCRPRSHQIRACMHQPRQPKIGNVKTRNVRHESGVIDLDLDYEVGLS